MKKISVFILATMIVFIVGWFVWYQYFSSPHKPIAVEEVFNVRFAGESIDNENNWRHATKNEAVQIIEWFNSAQYIRRLENPRTARSKLSVIVIELNPKEKHGDLITKRGEIIMIYNSENGFEVHRENNDQVQIYV